MKTRKAIKEMKRMLECFEAFSHLAEVLEDMEHKEYLLQEIVARYEKLYKRNSELKNEIKKHEANLSEVIERGKVLIVDQDARLKSKTDEISEQIKEVATSLFIAKAAAADEYRRAIAAHKSEVEKLKNEEARLSKSIEMLSKENC